MSFLQLVLSLDKTIRDLILFCRQCHSDPYRNSDEPGAGAPVVASKGDHSGELERRCKTYTTRRPL